jgi:hypothetical protein
VIIEEKGKKKKKTSSTEPNSISLHPFPAINLDLNRIRGSDKTNLKSQGPDCSFQNHKVQMWLNHQTIGTSTLKKPNLTFYFYLFLSK